MPRDYETMYILRPQLEEEQVDAAMKKLEDFVAKTGGTTVRHEKKGKKKLAYECKDQREGHYLLYNFALAPESVSELKRFFRLSEETVRFILLRQDEAGAIQPKVAVAPPTLAAVPVPAEA